MVVAEPRSLDRAPSLRGNEAVGVAVAEGRPWWDMPPRGATAPASGGRRRCSKSVGTVAFLSWIRLRVGRESLLRSIDTRTG